MFGLKNSIVKTWMKHSKCSALAMLSITKRGKILVRRGSRLPPWPDVYAGMARLQPLGFLAPCSNASIAMSVRMARYADFRWDAICGAELARDYKPSPSVYLAAAKALALPPERVVMVAAHNGDLAAASQAGLRTAFFPRANEHGPGQKTNLVPDGDWDFVAADMYDLARKIEEQL